MKIVRRFFKILLKTLLVLVLFIAGYVVAERLLSRWTVTAAGDEGPKKITAFLLSNGVHTDLVLPVVTDLKNWSQTFAYQHTLSRDTVYQWVAVGWGDKGFYLNTPEWKDLTLSTAFKAVTGLGETALHVTYYKHVSEGPLCRKLQLTEGQYRKLAGYVEAALDRNAGGAPVYIDTRAQYNRDDAFYEAKGAYSLFHTCNSWTNNALKTAGLKACKWAAFDKGLLYQYRQQQ
ncbi:TIGR02117 family protein [Niabella beijingensis]|uniref:TIGR02117 family protein n=1 Tax=Niabella beijingensis TaxID=2872700 RepID=UPI001CBFA02B|nr:TIGR02117 family protein [Niabella beijingensis]MBZ4189150.1 TIGR02117 family protein [Niabella beijingensis]